MMQLTRYGMMLALLVVLACLAANVRAEIEIGINGTNAVQQPAEQRMLTLDEMLVAMRERQEQADLQAVAQQVVENIEIDIKLAAHCAERMPGVRELVLKMQALMLKEHDVDRIAYKIDHVPLDRGFCAMVALSELRFTVIYDLEDRQLRTFVKAVDFDPAMLYVRGKGYFVYKSKKNEVQRSAVREYFAQWELEREKCRWRPCDD